MNGCIGFSVKRLFHRGYVDEIQQVDYCNLIDLAPMK